MAITQTNVSTPSSENIFQDTAMGNAVDSIKASSARVYSIVVDNSANGGAASYLKLFNLASGSVTAGVSAPDEIILVPAGQVVSVSYITGAATGKVFGTALSAICVTTGGTAGSTSPVSSVIVSVTYV